jgi:autotransporter-associated beta strand protein
MSAAKSGLFAYSILLPMALMPGRAEANVCPAFGADSDCGAIITITNSGSTISFTGQGPYDGSDDTMVGVVNNSSQPIYALGLKSTTNIFGFDSDGITTYGAPGNAKDATGYGGPNAYFTNSSGNGNSGVVNFVNALKAAGGTTYFSLENALTKPTAIQDIVNNSINVTLGGRFNGTAFGILNLFRPTNITAVFTPNGGLTLAQAEAQTGFTGFDFRQTITNWPNPGLHQAGSTSSLTAPPSFLDPPPGGYTYCVTTGWTACQTSYPFYPTTKTSTTVNLFDSPRDPTLKSGQYLIFSDRLIGILPTFVAGTDCLAAGTCVDLGVGFDWTSNYNGSYGGIAVTASNQPIDPATADGLGGINIISVYETTTYSPFYVTTINGVVVPAGASLIIDLSQLYFTENDQASQQSTVEFAGGTLRPTTTYTVQQPVQLDPAGGTIDSTNGNITVAGVITGPGGLTVDGGNAVFLANANSYTGGTTIQSAVLVLGSTTAAGTGPITIDGGVLAAGFGGLSIANALILTGPAALAGGPGVFALSGDISGSGSLESMGPGTMILSGTATYTGATTVSAGTLAILGTVSGTSSVTVGAGASLIDAGSISSPTVTVDSGGTLYNDGLINAADLTVNGELRGTGTVNAPTTVNGTLAPGVSPGTLTFTEPLVLTASATTEIDIDGTGTGTDAGNYSRIIVTGSTATLGGVLEPLLRGPAGSGLPDWTNTYAPPIGQQFVVLAAEGGIAATSSFSGLVQPDGLLPGTRFDAMYAPTTLTLVVTPAAYGNLKLAGLPQTANEAAVGAALDAIRPAAGIRMDDTHAALFYPLYGLPGSAIPATLDQFAPTIYGDGLMAARDTWYQMADAVSDQLAARRAGSGSAQTVPGPHGSTIWTSGIGQFTDVNGSGAPSSHTSVGGAIAGIDVPAGRGVTLGAAIGGGSVSTSSGGATDSGTAMQFTIYGGWQSDRFFLDGQAAFLHMDETMRRTLSLFGTAARGSGGVNGGGAQVHGGMRLAYGRFQIEPTLGLTVIGMSAGTVTESTGGPAALQIGSQPISSVQSLVGVRFGTQFALTPTVPLRVNALVGWQHEYSNTTAPTTATFQIAGAWPFTVNTAPIGRDAARLGAGFDVVVTPRVSLYGSYQAALAEHATSQYLTGGVRVAW